MPEQQPAVSKETELMRIASARGIFFPTAEIFSGGIGGLWDYGPIGLRIFNNYVSEWRRLLDEVGAYEISGSVLLPRKVLQASGHEANFFDPMVTCRKCGSTYRIDKLLEEADRSGNFEGMSMEEYSSLAVKHGLKCERCGTAFGSAEKFSLMLSTKIGIAAETNAYLRPEACQSIYLDFKRILDTYSGRKLPLIIAQIGKAFRNEISPRNNLLRQREFYQHDMEVFFMSDDDYILKPEEDIEIGVMDHENPGAERVSIRKAMELGIIESSITAYWTSKWIRFMEGVGFAPESIRIKKLRGKEKPFYAKEAFDLEVNRDGAWVEITGIHHRNDYDMSQYLKFGADVPKVGGRVPNVFEISAGADRIFYLLLYTSLQSDSKRHWLSLNEKIAPYRYAVFPLQRDEKLAEMARKVYSGLVAKGVQCYYADTGGIGKMYAKADEIGVQMCITVDYQGLEDGTVTVRDRDTTKQRRVAVGELA